MTCTGKPTLSWTSVSEASATQECGNHHLKAQTLQNHLNVTPAPGGEMIMAYVKEQEEQPENRCTVPRGVRQCYCTGWCVKHKPWSNSKTKMGQFCCFKMHNRPTVIVKYLPGFYLCLVDTTVHHILTWFVLGSYLAQITDESMMIHLYVSAPHRLSLPLLYCSVRIKSHPL